MSDDHTQRFPRDEDANDLEQTRPIGDADEDLDVTRAVPADDDATYAMPASDATRRIPAQTAQQPTATQRFPQQAAPTGPVTERLAVRHGRDNAPWIIAVIVVIGLVVGAALGYSQSDPSDRNVLARALVAPDGGTLEFD